MSAKKSAKGKRYTPEEKQTVVDFVNAANSEKGRGGVAAAVKKFGISGLTITSWVKNSGGSVKLSKKGAGRSGGARSSVLDQLAGLDREIATRRKELEALESKFQALKAKL
ncbi:MAG: hypothetical protein QM755_02565 [Luteolibacter sp.]